MEYLAPIIIRIYAVTYKKKEIIKEVLEKGERPLSIYWGD